MQPNFTKYMDQIALLHQLPMTSLEVQLKRCKDIDPSYHERVLSPEEMSQYFSWMSTTFGGKADFRFSADDISMITGGNVAKASQKILQNPRNRKALAEITDTFLQPTEEQFFSEQQSTSVSRFLRHMPAYWKDSDSFEVYYVFSGTCPVWFEDEVVALTPGSVLLIPPGTVRACNCPEDDCVMFFYMIRSSTFSKIFWEQLSDQSLMSLFFKQALGGKNNTTYLRFETGSDSTIEMLLYSIFQQYCADNPYSAQMTNSLMGTFFLYLLQNYEQTALVSKNSKLHWKPEYASLLSYIHGHYQTVTLEDLSREFNYSRRQVIRIIQNSTAKTFSQLLTQLRMEKAAAMIAANVLTMENIATEVGYASLSSFYRVFGSYYGMTPGEWKHNKQ